MVSSKQWSSYNTLRTTLMHVLVIIQMSLVRYDKSLGMFLFYPSLSSGITNFIITPTIVSSKSTLTIIIICVILISQYLAAANTHPSTVMMVSTCSTVSTSSSYTERTTSTPSMLADTNTMFLRTTNINHVTIQHLENLLAFHRIQKDTI